MRSDTHLITELRDSFGRSIGYTYAKNGAIQQTVHTGYGADGRINSAGFVHGGAAKNFGFEYVPGSNLLQTLTKPNGMTLTQTYEATRDLLIGMAYHRGSNLVAQRTYTYDILEELRMSLPVILDCFPEKLLNQRNIACPIGVRQGGSMRCSCIPYVVKITFVVLQSIAYIIKTDAMSHVAIYHADNMTPYAECPDSYLDSLFVQF